MNDGTCWVCGEFAALDADHGDACFPCAFWGAATLDQQDAQIAQLAAPLRQRPQTVEL